jgi:hypothetical protein
MTELRYGLTYAPGMVGYDRILLPRDYYEATLAEMLPFLPEELRDMPKWALCNMLWGTHLIGFGAGAAAGGGGVVGTRSVVFLNATSASNQTWTVLADWNSSDNYVDVVSHGGAGQSGPGPRGGAGGGFARAVNITLTPSGSALYRVRAGNSGAGTSNASWFGGSTLSGSSVGIQGGASGDDGGAGASTTSAVGDIKRAGGNGGAGVNYDPGEEDDDQDAGGGGGGPAGPTGVGGNGADASDHQHGGAGGTADGGAVAGGAGGTTGVAGSAGTAGAQYTSVPGAVNAGPGGGGGGGVGTTGGGANAGNGATYGGGGGGARPGTPGTGGQALIIITNNASS